MAKDKYSHLIEVNEEEKRLYIYRVHIKSGKRHLLTYTDLPNKTYDEDPDGFKEFARIFGENILFDSEIVRRILDL